MRRYLLSFAMLQGLLLPIASLGATPHTHAKPGHAKAAPAVAHPTAHASAKQSSAAKATHHNLSRSQRQLALERSRRKSSRLKPVHLEATALIDPVPRGAFPFPAPLKGSHESLVRQNVRSQEDGLERVQDDADLLVLRRSNDLVAVPATNALLVDERLPANRRYCRPWTAQFLSDLSRVHYGRFHRPLQVNSAVRTVEYQRHLELVNGNAAPAEGEDASPHLTGATIDIAKKGLSTAEIGWIRAYLMPLQVAGKIDVEEEFYQSCFHITVYRSYVPSSAASQAKAAAGSRKGDDAALVAARVR